MPVMGGVGALFGADMFASADGSKPNRVVGDIGGTRHTTGRWPSSYIHCVPVDRKGRTFCDATGDALNSWDGSCSLFRRRRDG